MTVLPSEGLDYNRQYALLAEAVLLLYQDNSDETKISVLTSSPPASQARALQAGDKVLFAERE